MSLSTPEENPAEHFAGAGTDAAAIPSPLREKQVQCWSGTNQPVHEGPPTISGVSTYTGKAGQNYQESY